MRKNILIIGGNSGVGFQLVKLLQKENNVIVACRNTDNIKDQSVTHIPFDVETDILDTNEIPEVLDGFVYCPGSINLRPFKGLKEEVFVNDFSINVLGAVRILQVIQTNLQKSPNTSSVVLFSTVAVKTGMPYHSSVSTSKGAIEGLARSLAAEFAPKVRFNVIAPSLLNTPMAEKFLNNETKLSNAAARHPLSRVGNALEIAQMAKFLLSDSSSWMTAQTITIDGGIGSIKN